MHTRSQEDSRGLYVYIFAHVFKVSADGKAQFQWRGGKVQVSGGGGTVTVGPRVDRCCSFTSQTDNSRSGRYPPFGFCLLIRDHSAIKHTEQASRAPAFYWTVQQGAVTSCCFYVFKSSSLTSDKNYNAPSLSLLCPDETLEGGGAGLGDGRVPPLLMF